METYKLFLVEDDPAIARAIENHLVMWGYEIARVKNFDRVWEELAAFSPHLVLLDISLPHQNGFQWCEKIRKSSRVPIIFLSSASGSENIITAMDLGGDDFIPKPFDLSVLTAKVQAVLRRTYAFQGTQNQLEHKGVVLDLTASTLTYQGQRLELTKNDFRILQVLLENAGHTVSRSQLITRLWENDSFIDQNTLTVSMARLRKKLEELGLSGFVVTQKGQGYFVP